MNRLTFALLAVTLAGCTGDPRPTDVGSPSPDVSSEGQPATSHGSDARRPWQPDSGWSNHPPLRVPEPNCSRPHTSGRWIWIWRDGNRDRVFLADNASFSGGINPAPDPDPYGLLTR